MKNIFYKNFATVLFLLLGFLANAQATPPPPPPSEEAGDIGAITQPIDGYVIWLLVVGIVFIIAALKKKSLQINKI